MLRPNPRSVRSVRSLRSVAALLLAAAPLGAQSPQPAAPPAVRVPAFPNSTCPIMGKKVSMPLFVDTELGRIWLCCKPCARKVLADVATAHATAYPAVETVANGTCPVSGEPVQPNAFAVVGTSIVRLSSPACVAAVERAPQRTLDAAQAIAGRQPEPAPHRHRPRVGDATTTAGARGKDEP